MHFQKRYVIITEIIKDGRFGHGNIRNRDRCGSAAHQLGYHHHLHDAGKKPQNATAALTGASNDSFYDKNRGRTKEARLHKLTTILTVLFFVLILFIDIVMPLITK